MKLELNKTYMTKRGIPVKITMKTSWGFFGTLQDNSKVSVKYKEDGKVPNRGTNGSLLDIKPEEEKVKYDENGKVAGWSFGNKHDIKGSDDQEEEPPKKDWYEEQYHARKEKLEAEKKAKEVLQKEEQKEEIEQAEETPETTER